MNSRIRSILVSLVTGSLIGAYLMYLLMPKPIQEGRMNEILKAAIAEVTVENKIEVKALDLSDIRKLKNVSIHFYQCGNETNIRTERTRSINSNADTTIYLLNIQDDETTEIK